MKSPATPRPRFDRREFLKAGGALIIGFSSAGFIGDQLAAQSVTEGAARGSVAGPPNPKQIDTWLAVHADNTATIFIGYVELGQGSTTSLLQVAAEELDLSMNQVSTIRLDTNLTPNQGGTYSSSSIARGSPAIRTAAAEARQALLQLASKKLDAPIGQLTVSKGVVSAAASNGGSPQKSVTYGELIGDKRFNLAFTGTAPLKPVADYKLVGTSPTRNDIPDKVSGKYVYLQNVRLPGMLHGRIVRPRGQGAYGAGAKVSSLDETSIAHIPGARVVRKGDFVGVVADREWDAIRAAQQLKITWDMPASLPGSDGVYAAMRAEKTTDRAVLEKGNVESAFASAAHVASSTYHAPYQAHAPFGPNGALADVTSDSALVICSTQDVYATRNTLAGVLGLPLRKFASSITKVRAPTATVVMTTPHKPRQSSRSWRRNPCASSSCAGTSMAGISTAPPTLGRFAPQLMPPAKSSPISTTAGITIGALLKPPRSSRSEPLPPRGDSALPSK